VNIKETDEFIKSNIDPTNLESKPSCSFSKRNSSSDSSFDCVETISHNDIVFFAKENNIGKDVNNVESLKDLKNSVDSSVEAISDD
jgi:hypothetical protein